MGWLTPILCLVVLAAGSSLARRSPHADLIDEYFVKGTEGARYSNNLIEDARLDVPGLIEKYGYPVEVHNVVTDDGYILEMHRIPHGRDRNDRPDPNKPVVLVMHGLLSSSADWVVLGPGSALAYALAEEGFDVWLGNARGTYYSRNHVKLDPDRAAFWKFSWDQIGNYDLPAMIDYALQATGKDRLHYVGHSQGTTAFFVMGSLRPEYNDKIVSMQALAPVAFMENNDFPLFVALAPHADNIVRLAGLVGMNELLPNHDLFTLMGQTFCSDDALTQAICTQIVFFAGGSKEDQFNATMFPVKLGHAPAGAAVRQVAHYGQLIRKPSFRRYDWGRAGNWREYRRLAPPDYDLARCTSPVFLHYVDHDHFAPVSDVQKLFNSLGSPVGMFRVPHATFSHVDFMWGIGAKTLVYDRMINMMKSLPNN